MWPSQPNKRTHREHTRELCSPELSIRARLVHLSACRLNKLCNLQARSGFQCHLELVGKQYLPFAIDSQPLLLQAGETVSGQSKLAERTSRRGAGQLRHLAVLPCQATPRIVLRRALQSDHSVLAPLSQKSSRRPIKAHVRSKKCLCDFETLSAQSPTRERTREILRACSTAEASPAGQLARLSTSTCRPLKEPIAI